MKQLSAKATLFSAILVLLLFSGCSASMDSAAEPAPEAYEATAEEDHAYEYTPEAADDWAEYSAADDAAFDDAVDEGSGAAEFAMLAPDNDEGIELSYTVHLQLQTTEFMAGIRTLNNTVADLKGYTMRANIQGKDLLHTEQLRTANYEFQIPSANLSRFLMAMEDNYNLLSLQQEAEDITRQHQRTDNQLEVLREQEQQIRESMESTDDPELQSELAADLRDVQTQINKMQSRSDEMRQQVLYSTVNVQLREALIPAEIAELSWEERLDAVKTVTGTRFLNMAQNSLLFLISALPAFFVLVILGLLAFVIYRIYIWNNRRKAAKHTSQMK